MGRDDGDAAAHAIVVDEVLPVMLRDRVDHRGELGVLEVERAPDPWQRPALWRSQRSVRGRRRAHAKAGQRRGGRAMHAATGRSSRLPLRAPSGSFEIIRHRSSTEPSPHLRSSLMLTAPRRTPGESLLALFLGLSMRMPFSSVITSPLWMPISFEGKLPGSIALTLHTDHFAVLVLRHQDSPGRRVRPRRPAGSPTDRRGDFKGSGGT